MKFGKIIAIIATLALVFSMTSLTVHACDDVNCSKSEEPTVTLFILPADFQPVVIHYEGTETQEEIEALMLAVHDEIRERYTVTITLEEYETFLLIQEARNARQENSEIIVPYWPWTDYSNLFGHSWSEWSLASVLINGITGAVTHGYIRDCERTHCDARESRFVRQ